MYLGEPSLTSLYQFLNGLTWLAFHYHIELTPDTSKLHDWVAKKYGWRYSTAGWRNIILQECGNDERKALETFFDLFEEYAKCTMRSGDVKTVID